MIKLFVKKFNPKNIKQYIKSKEYGKSEIIGKWQVLHPSVDEKKAYGGQESFYFV